MFVVHIVCADVSVSQPAVEYVWAVLAQHGRQPWVTIHKYSDELFFGALAMLDTYFITHYNGTFSENFYGLHRVNAADGKVRRYHACTNANHKDTLQFTFCVVRL